jgi:sterol desaturase/sphingolipid hydroxylase (fatty acid hydroxylase superfamily)
VRGILLDAIRIGYPGVMLGTFLFLYLWEGGRPRVALVRRGQHVLRNIALFAVMVIVADGVVGGALIGFSPDRLTVSQGLLTPLALPVAGEAILGVLVTDFVSYAFHRVSHGVYPLWLVHAVHHSDSHLDVTTGLRFHPVDMACYVTIVVVTLGVLGLPLWVEGLRALALNPLTMAQHANVVWPQWIERRVGWLLVTPALHRVHHSTVAPGIDANFGQVFSFWDRLFGSYIAPAAADPARFGIPALAGREWQTIGGMLATPWRARAILR